MDRWLATSCQRRQIKSKATIRVQRARSSPFPIISPESERLIFQGSSLTSKTSSPISCWNALHNGRSSPAFPTIFGEQGKLGSCRPTYPRRHSLWYRGSAMGRTDQLLSSRKTLHMVRTFSKNAGMIGEAHLEVRYSYKRISYGDGISVTKTSAIGSLGLDKRCDIVPHRYREFRGTRSSVDGLRKGGPLSLRLRGGGPIDGRQYNPIEQLCPLPICLLQAYLLLQCRSFKRHQDLQRHSKSPLIADTQRPQGCDLVRPQRHDQMLY